VWAPSETTTYDVSGTGLFQPLSQTDPFGTTVTLTWDAHRLAVTAVSVPLASGGPVHAVEVALDPFTRQAAQITDINGSRVAATFDALGRVAKIANLGRDGETVDDLDHPTIAFDYTFASYDSEEETWTPASAHSATRRKHWFGTETTDFDEAWVYFEGMGRELLTKAKAAPDVATPSAPRFVGTGRILLDAKGNPVKQYEPYFSDTSAWEPDATAAMQGVTPILRYDPLGRLVRTDHPDGTHERVERTPWEERHFDRNDTVPDVTFSGGTPTTLADALTAFETGAATAPTSHPWLHARTTADITGVDDLLTVERGKALRRSAAQAWWVRDTPTVLHVDVLGRPFLEQRAKSSAKTDGAYTDTTDVHITLDVLGRATRIAVRYQGTSARVEQLATTDVFDLLGRSVQHVRRDAQSWNATTEEAEGGMTWTLSSVGGQPVRSWDSRDFAFRRTFDALRRPVALFTKMGSGTEVCSVFTRYGEQAGEDAQERRLYGHPWRVYDQSGRVTTEAVDIDGRVTATTRTHVLRYNTLPDWTDTHDETDPEQFDDHDPAWRKVAHDATVTTPNDEVFWHDSIFDVAGRPTYEAEWRNSGGKSEKRYVYDAGGRLLREDVRLRSTDPDDWRPKLGDVIYNARGQRLTALTGDDGDTTAGLTMEATYIYDPETFRLLRSTTERLADEVVLDDYRWVHDATGNVTFQEQAHSDVVWYDNAIVTPHRRYRYDALDRLVEAGGREHDGTVDTSAGYAGSRRQTSRPYGLGAVAHRADGTALRTYTQRFTYDDVGNILELRHIQGGIGGETFVRAYAYETAGATDGSLFNNQLLLTTIGSTDYAHTYDAHGNTTSLSHLPEMAWDPFDRLHSVQTQARYPLVPDPGDPEAALSTPLQHDWFYLYDAAGQRTRKVRAKLVGDPEAPDGESCWEERVYVGSFEVWRRYNADGTTDTERETLHVMDDQRRVAMVETMTWEGGAELVHGVDEEATPRWRFQLDDHLGTSVGEVTELGEEIGWEEYHPYGTTALSSFDATREVSAKRYRYTGMERDEETSLCYHRQRYLACWIGTWISTDPIGVSGGMLLYGYANSSPIKFMDPLGTQPDDVIIEGEVDGVLNRFEAGSEEALVIGRLTRGEGLTSEEANKFRTMISGLELTESDLPDRLKSRLEEIKQESAASGGQKYPIRPSEVERATSFVLLKDGSVLQTKIRVTDPARLRPKGPSGVAEGSVSAFPGRFSEEVSQQLSEENVEGVVNVHSHSYLALPSAGDIQTLALSEEGTINSKEVRVTSVVVGLGTNGEIREGFSVLHRSRGLETTGISRVEGAVDDGVMDTPQVGPIMDAVRRSDGALSFGRGNWNDHNPTKSKLRMFP
jgi:RHS repeat-associated protein